jgi:CRP/FNR family cyclic AMP-dependent transcriptional regulator
MSNQEPCTNAVLCKAGDKSGSLWILLAGALVVFKGEIQLTTIHSVEIVGEMGLVTGLSRSATISAKQDVVLLEIQKLHLDKLMKDDIDLERKLYRNMLRSLCEKLRSTSSQLAESATKTDREIMASLA